MPKAQGKKAKIIADAIAYAFRKEMVSKARIQRFNQLLKAYREAPEIFKIRKYLAVLEECLTDIRKYVIGVSSWESEIDILNLEDKIAPSLLGIELEEQEEGEQEK